jgi:ubiquinone/menaquinone biosynthesis C-methylase UbiE
MLPPQSEKVKQAFSKQAPVFDLQEENNEILKWMRRQIHEHCLQFFKKGDHILEMNCGTGIDAVFFAKQGINVHATDISKNMLNELEKKIYSENLSSLISFSECSFTGLYKLPEKKYDHIFSDFGGLNCADDLKEIFKQFDNLLHPRGTVTLVMMPPVCPWEILSALKGNFKIAFRRFFKKGAKSNIEGVQFTTYYYSPQQVKKSFSKKYKILSLKGIGSLSPPPYKETFPKKFPKLYKTLTIADEKLSDFFPFNRWADHFIITLSYQP